MGKKKRPQGIYKNLTSYGDVEFSKYMRRAFLAAAGYDAEDLERPIVGIADTSSDYNPCHRQMPELVDTVKRGVLEEGGLPLVFPTLSLNEVLVSPTTMLYRTNSFDWLPMGVIYLVIPVGFVLVAVERLRLLRRALRQ